MLSQRMSVRMISSRISTFTSNRLRKAATPWAATSSPSAIAPTRQNGVVGASPSSGWLGAQRIHDQIKFSGNHVEPEKNSGRALKFKVSPLNLLSSNEIAQLVRAMSALTALQRFAKPM